MVLYTVDILKLLASIIVHSSSVQKPVAVASFHVYRVL